MTNGEQFLNDWYDKWRPVLFLVFRHLSLLPHRDPPTTTTVRPVTTFNTAVIALSWEPRDGPDGCNKGLDRQARRMMNRDWYDNEHNQTKYCIQGIYAPRELSCVYLPVCGWECQFRIFFQSVFIVNESASRIVNPRHQTCRFGTGCFYCSVS
jgi:hypothetical protein